MAPFGASVPFSSCKAIPQRPKVGSLISLESGTRNAYMFGLEDVFIEIDTVDEDVLLVDVITPVGTVSIMGNAEFVDRVLYVRKTHVDGLTPGALCRRGLNLVGQKMLEVADVDEIVIEGGARSTGLRKGKAPRVIRFPHPHRVATGE
jgi:hypothetical protein